MFKATCQLLRLLNHAIQNNKDPVNLNSQLYRRLTAAAMNCPGFTVCMKGDVAYITNMSVHDQRTYEHPVFAECWLHQYAMAPKPGVKSDVLEVSTTTPVLPFPMLTAPSGTSSRSASSRSAT